MRASVVLLSFIKSAACHNNGMIYLFTCCDLFEIKCLLVWLWHNIFVHSSKTLAALSSRDAVVNKALCCIELDVCFCVNQGCQSSLVITSAIHDGLQVFKPPIHSSLLSTPIPQWMWHCCSIKHVTGIDTVCWRFIHGQEYEQIWLIDAWCRIYLLIVAPSI